MLFHRISIWFDYLMHLPSPRLPGVSHLSINILGPGPARARPAAAGRFVPQGPGYAFQDAFSSFQGSDFWLRGSNIPFLGYGFSFQVPASSIQAPISTLTSELLQFSTLVGFDLGWFLKHNCNNYYCFLMFSIVDTNNKIHVFTC